MSIQHFYPPQRLALAIALALGCADISLAEQPANIPTTAEQQERLKTFAEAADTKKHNVNVPRKGNVKWTGKNDLVIVSKNGKFPGLVDGGRGTNILQLDAANHPTLAETRNFLAFQVTKGEWEHTGNFAGWGVIEPDTTLTNTGQIDGQIGVLGAFDNKGVVANRVIVEPGARMTNSGAVIGGVHVRENAIFSGNGSVEFLSVAGQLRVGPETGAPSIKGNFELLSGAELIYGVDADGRSSTINVEGTATLNNTTLKIDAVRVENMGTSEHTVIRAGNIEGEFGTITSNLAFMTATPHYTGAQVGLTYARNDVPLEAAATSDNAREFVANIQVPKPVESIESKPIKTATVARKPAAAKPNIDEPALKLSEPPKIASAAEKNTSPLKTATAVAKPNAAINALLGTNMTTAANAIDQLGGYDTADLGNATLSSLAPIGTGMLSAMDQRNSDSVHTDGQVWVQAIGNSGSIGKQSGSDALKHSTKGLLLGTDWAVSPDWRLGVIGGKTQTRLDGHQFDGGLDSWHLGAYALRQDGPVALRLGAIYGEHDGSTKRHVAFNGFRDRLKGRYDANTQQVFGQVGYNLNAGHFDIEPYVHLGYQRYQRDRYTEKGGDAALQFNGQTQDHYNSNLGLRLARPFALDQGVRLVPRLNLGWKHLYGDVRGSSRQRLASGGTTYTVEGIELDRDSLFLEAGLDLAVSPRHTLGVSYNGETGQDNRNGALMGQWRMMF